MYMPVPAMHHAMMAPKGPVAAPKRPGRLKMPAPTIEPTTMPVSATSDSFAVFGVSFMSMFPQLHSAVAARQIFAPAFRQI